MSSEASVEQETTGACCVDGTCRHERGSVVDGTATQRLQFSLAGFSHPSEATAFGARLANLPGVSEAVVNPITERAVVRVDPSVIEASEILGLLAEKGLEAGRSLARWHLQAPGLTCARCAARVEEAVRSVPGVEAVTASRGAAELTIEYIPATVDLAQLREVLWPGHPDDAD